MSELKAWVSAARLRTLPLSVSGIIVGSSLGSKNPLWLSPIFWLSILTTIGFQVLSNFANDYGDGIKGTDDDREGEQRLVASGIITPKQMKTVMLKTIVITLLVAVTLIYEAFGSEDFLHSLLFFILGLASIIAAVKYTVGKNAYGYSGLGDLFVFMFFGLLSVLGSYYLFAHHLKWELLLPASSIGLLSMAVLNLNNMRDIENDEKNNKRTLVVKIGSSKAKMYHYFLIIGAMVLLVTFTCLHFTSPIQFIYLVAFVPLFLNMWIVFKNKEARLLDSELKKVALSTFLISLLWALFF